MTAHPLTGLTCLLLLQVMGEALSRALDLPFPGPVTGMILLLVALRWQALQQVVSTAAPGLLSHLSLLFVPVGVGVMSHLSVISDFGWQIALVIVLSTWAGMVATLAVLRFGRERSGARHA
jgi:holin-like protein